VIAFVAEAAPSDIYLVASVVLLAIALLLIALEAFIPSGGLLGLLGGTAFLASVVSMFLYSRTGGVLLLMGSAIVAPFLLVGIARVWAASPIARRFAVGDQVPPKVLDAFGDGAEATPVHDPDDPDAADAARAAASRSRLARLEALVGHSGVAATDLRPAGFIEIDGRRLDAMAEAGLIEAGTPIRIVSAAEGLLRVRVATPATLS